ncbi:family 43 glycosylhydrolase [Streptomyces sp. A7024]|uniref:Family 43 glycosylhydrolase n=1 Tax=Streptomyces coryli TaxID=1128680 RepID=A0A6G4TXJ2_9ACTN|nr:family 43 glycosylhydrolase [Streptomyces coryli]NGN64533.1 family 43 glycosylhydrolase [Streptomyces coryli]
MRRLMRTAALLGALVAPLVPAPAGAADEQGTYANPVTQGVVDTFPDPAVIKGKDGYWYAYGTENPVFQSRGENTERKLPILKSRDMAHWEYAGEVFTPESQPSWHDKSRLWAPDVRYSGGKYHLSYSVPGKDTVGVATAPTPTGPWTDQGAMLPKPSGCATGNIDQATFTDDDGTAYLYWGSYDTLCVAKLNADRTRIKGKVTEIAKGSQMEGGYVIRHGRYYYLLYSDAGCCDGAYSGYQIKAGRSTSPFGPFTDDEGVKLTEPTSKGAIVAGANGNKWIGPGHHAVQTDLSGQDWLLYHGISADDPDLDRIPALPDRQLTKRPMLMDRMDWIDGWPVMRAGAGPSEEREQAPVAEWDAGGSFGEGSLDGWRSEGSAWQAAEDKDAHGYAAGASSDKASFLLSDDSAPADVRAEADLKVTSGSGAAALVLSHRGRGDYTAAWLDRGRKALVTEAVVDGRSRGTKATALPDGFAWDQWHTVTAELRGDRLTAEVSEDRLGDPVARQEREVPEARSGAVGTAVRGGSAAADNVGAARLYTPVTERVPEPSTGQRLPGYSDEFTGSGQPGEDWSWVRGPAAGADIGDGGLTWPTQGGALGLDKNTAPVLTRAAPKGDYTVETKLHFAPDQAGQQAGLILYGGDDRFFKNVHSVAAYRHHAGQVLHRSEFGKEGPRPTTDPPQPVAQAPIYGGPTADTMWLKLQKRTDEANGETEVRAATSRDGKHWVWNGVWTLPGTEELKLGLVSMGAEGADARFAYVRTYVD